MSEASKEMLGLVKAVGPAVDAFEARITVLVKQVAVDSPETAADIQAAVIELRRTLADAADGVDEADVPPPPPG